MAILHLIYISPVPESVRRHVGAGRFRVGFSQFSVCKRWLKVIPLKLFYYQTLKKCNKKMGSPCWFTRQHALKMGYFYCFRVKNSNHLHTELSLGYFEDTKFYFENNASFIYISRIASFTPSLIP